MLTERKISPVAEFPGEALERVRGRGKDDEAQKQLGIGDRSNPRT